VEQFVLVRAQDIGLYTNENQIDQLRSMKLKIKQAAYKQKGSLY
jgi:hypothetical protein